MSRSMKTIIPILALLLGCVMAPGCEGVSTGGDTPSAGRKLQAIPREYEERIAEAESRTTDEKCAACEAMRCAEDSNAGSCFRVSRVKVAGEWAMVAVEESGVPAEEAVGFDVFLRKQEKGTWEVAETGSDITADQLTGAPPELFSR